MNAFRKRRVRIVESHVHRVGRNLREIVYRQFSQSFRHGFGVTACFGRESVGLVLLPARQPVEKNGPGKRHWRIEQYEENNAQSHRRLVDIEGLPKTFGVPKEGHKQKEYAELHDSERDSQRNVFFLEMADFVRHARSRAEVWKAQKDPSRNRFSILLSRTNHLSYHLGQLVLGLK